jgi:hypothetical protein
MYPALDQLTRQTKKMRITINSVAVAIYYSDITKKVSIAFVVTINVAHCEDL